MCLPIIGQIGGFLYIQQGKERLQSRFYEERILGGVDILRGILNMLGLGIVCLLICCLVTLIIAIKQKLK